jgi:hypothetical protein
VAGDGLTSTATKTIVTTIVAAAVTAIVGWIGGWLPALWAAVKAGAAWTWAMLSYPIAVPAAILALLVVPFLIRAARGIRYVVAPPAQPQIIQPAEAPLSDLEERLMRLLAEIDGRLIHFDEVASRLMVSNLILQQTCEALSVRGYIEPNNHIVRGLHIALTREGRDFVIRQGFVR